MCQNKQCQCAKRMKDEGLERQQEELADLTRAEKEALLFVLRRYRDNCNADYNQAIDYLPANGMTVSDFCNGWDKLKL